MIIFIVSSRVFYFVLLTRRRWVEGQAGGGAWRMLPKTSCGLIPLLAQISTGFVCLLHGCVLSWESWLSPLFCIRQCWVPRSRCKNTLVLSVFCILTMKNRCLPFSRPASPPGFLRWDVVAKWTRFHTSPLFHFSPLINGDLISFMSKKKYICWNVRQNTRLTNWTVAKSTAWGDDLIGIRCRWRKHTDVMGCVVT